MRNIVCLVVFLFIFTLALAKHEKYDGYSVYQVFVNNADQMQLVYQMENRLNLDIWSPANPGRPGQVLVPGEKKQLFEANLKELNVEFTIVAENIKESLELEDKLRAEASRRTSNASRADSEPSFDRIYTNEEVEAFLDALAAAYPETVTLVNAGKSFEGRDIKYLKISSTNFQDTSKPIVFMESLLHAREWVTLPAAFYAIQKLVIDGTEQDLLRDIDWIILPVANPDGFSYTHTGDRFWRKNRATGYTTNDICVGVDLNRNFDYLWATESSNNVCAETFHGRAAFSEPETAVIKTIFDEYKDRIELFLDIHSFGSLILYGYGTGILPPNGLFIHLAGVQMAQAIDAVKLNFNPDYVVGNSALTLYKSSGSAQDYGQTVATYSYTLELPTYRYGMGTILGFLVDPDYIEQFGFETWEGIKAGARFARNNYISRMNKV